MRLGLISDTHGHLDSRVLALFHGVDRILHAGDIGSPCIVAELEGIAPVTAVLGNNDWGLEFPLTEVVPLEGTPWLVHHIVDVEDPDISIGERFRNSRPGVVVFGHTHRPFHETRRDVVYLNPGYAGRPRFNQPRSVATVDVVAGKPPRVRFHPL